MELTESAGMPIVYVVKQLDYWLIYDGYGYPVSGVNFSLAEVREHVVSGILRRASSSIFRPVLTRRTEPWYYEMKWRWGVANYVTLCAQTEAGGRHRTINIFPLGHSVKANKIYIADTSPAYVPGSYSAASTSVGHYFKNKAKIELVKLQPGFLDPPCF